VVVVEVVVGFVDVDVVVAEVIGRLEVVVASLVDDSREAVNKIWVVKVVEASAEADSDFISAVVVS